VLLGDLGDRLVIGLPQNRHHLLLRKPCLLHGARVLSVSYTDNYITLVAGERRTITIEAAAPPRGEPWVVALDGWNVADAIVTMR